MGEVAVCRKLVGGFLGFTVGDANLETKIVSGSPYAHQRFGIVLGIRLN